MENLKNDLFIRACKREKTERTPIWIMRQAGRYLPQYRAIRKKADFMTMCKTPELASEVTIQPVDIIGVDAAIIFSDILVIPEAMGMELQMIENRGPVFPKPINNHHDISHLKNITPETDLKYVLDAVELTKKELNGRVPLIGFCGSPWTLMTYMVEGSGSKNFSKVKKFIFNNPELAHILLNKLASACAAYLSAKIQSGVNAVQIFDTWGGLLSPNDYKEFSLQYIQQIISNLKKSDEPVILFSKGVHHSIRKIAKSGIDVLGLDWTLNIGKIKKRVSHLVALQGNLDPTVLYADAEIIKMKAKAVLESYGEGTGHIFNLGHGILPDASPENLKVLVDFIKNESQRYHQF